MPRAKVAVTLDAELLDELDQLVARDRYPAGCSALSMNRVRTTSIQRTCLRRLNYRSRFATSSQGRPDRPCSCRRRTATFLPRRGLLVVGGQRAFARPHEKGGGEGLSASRRTGTTSDAVAPTGGRRVRHVRSRWSLRCKRYSTASSDRGQLRLTFASHAAIATSTPVAYAISISGEV